eukprot:TRINITY_DN3412_c0_g1_i1.p1 TRINITY_DN3412_c0_g1~~TRINITY_DN3412_c0_g1_i1.p1  ORF type:complete len:817 (+),score=283.91 TRINITY_DN3412_c0_g1_i1:252-2453(+)
MIRVSLLVLVLLTLPLDVEPGSETVVQRRKQLRRSEIRDLPSWVRAKINRLAHMMERGSNLNKTSVQEVSRLRRQYGESVTLQHVEKKRSLRIRLLEKLGRGTDDLSNAYEELLTNATVAGLIGAMKKRLRILQKDSLEIEEFVNTAEKLASDEMHQRELAIKNLTVVDPNKESTIDKVVSRVDKDLSSAIKGVEDKNTAGEHFHRAKDAENSKLETVVKMGQEKSRHRSDSKEDAGVVSHLIDPQGNQYVLSQPRDSFLHYEDNFLTSDIAYMICACFLCGTVVSFFNLPLFIGYIAGGTLLSPSMSNQLRSIVQVETLAQFGVYILLFLLGVEFSIVKLRRVLTAAVFGGVGFTTAVVVVVAFVVQTLLRAPTSEAVLIGFCVSLSSTIVVLGMMTLSESGTPYGQLVVAILVIQDVLLGLMVATVPILQAPSVNIEVYMSLLMNLVAAGTAAYLCALHISPRLVAFADVSHELFLLALCSLCFAFMLATDKMGLSIEVGCFLTGLTISPNAKYIRRVEDAFSPLKEFFGALFFASIGIHISPSFLMEEFLTLCVITLTVIGMKWLLAFSVFRVMFGLPTMHASLVGVALSQMSEFSFVIAAHGKAVGLINQKIYFMLLGITTLSLLLTPITWKFHPKPVHLNSPLTRASGNGQDFSSHEIPLYAIAVHTADPSSETDCLNVSPNQLQKFVWGCSFHCDSNRLPAFSDTSVSSRVASGLINAVAGDIESGL